VARSWCLLSCVIAQQLSDRTLSALTLAWLRGSLPAKYPLLGAVNPWWADSGKRHMGNSDRGNSEQGLTEARQTNARWLILTLLL
jgi:hypothetical protein